MVAPTSVAVATTGPTEPLPVGVPAPYAAVEADLAPGAPAGLVTLRLGGTGAVDLTGTWDPVQTRMALTVTDPTGHTTRHRSQRYGRVGGPVGAVALTLTGTWLTVWSRGPGGWTARGRAPLAARLDTRDEALLGSLHAGCTWSGRGTGPVVRVTAGGFGQLGLRDLRLVTEADGTPLRRAGRLLLTATSAGPGFFDTGHTSVWALAEESLTLEHTADLFFRRSDRPGVYGDHATHLVHDAGRWLVATSTWGDFAGKGPDATVSATVAESTADLLHGAHVLDTRPLALPTDGLRSVGVWDPYLVRTGAGWLAGFVSATAFFRFHPALATGPDLDSLTLRGAARDRIATEGTTLLQHEGGWLVLASDGRDGRPGQRARYPVFDLDLREIGALDAPYPTNLPWPSLARTEAGWLMVAFDGRPLGGRVPGYGTHGDVVLMRGE